MEAYYDIFELVVVIRDFWLLDAESYQRKYCTKHGEPLMSGHYIVNWPEHVRIRRFDEHAAFHGPFKFRHEAQTALEWMRQERGQFLGLSSDIIVETPSVAEPDFDVMSVHPDTVHKLRLVKGGKPQPQMTGRQPPDYRRAAKMAVHRG